MTLAVTLVELLIVIVIVTGLGVIAYAGLKTFDAPREARAYAQELSLAVKAAQQRAQRRNRAVLLRFSDLGQGAHVETREARGGRCVGAKFEDAEPVAELRAPERVGLTEWRKDQRSSEGPLALCASPGGLVFHAGAPLSARLELHVRRFTPEPEGPALKVSITARGASLK